MTIQEKLKNIEERFEQLKEEYSEKDNLLKQTQAEMVEIEKQLIYFKGAHQALTETLEEAEDLSEKATTETE